MWTTCRRTRSTGALCPAVPAALRLRPCQGMCTSAMLLDAGVLGLLPKDWGRVL